MYQNRVWPGVPNRVGDQAGLREAEPAEVQGDCGRRLALSAGETVRAHSRSGERFLGGQRLDLAVTKPTSVVLPTPKPPAIKILIASGCRLDGKALEPTEHCLQYV